MEAYSLFIKAQKLLPNFWEYEPEIIQEALKIKPFECEQLFVCQTIFHNHLVFLDHNVFEKACVVINGDPANFELTQDITPAEVCWGIKTIRMIDPMTKFNSEVLAYIVFLFYKDGLNILHEIVAKETSENDLPAVYFMNELTRNKYKPTPETIKTQVEFINKINKYLEYKTKKLQEELE